MNFEIVNLLPEINREAEAVYRLFSGIAMVIMFFSLMNAAFNGALGQVDLLHKTLLVIVIQAIVISQFPAFAKLLEQTGRSVLVQLDASPGEVHQRFGRLMIGTEDTEDDDTDLLSILFDDNGGLGKAILYAIVFLVGKLAFMIMWLGYVIQEFIMVFGITVSPVFVAMTGVNATKGISSRYFLELVGIAAWPLGWALASIMTEALLTFAARGGTMGADGGDFVNSSQAFFVVLLVSIWILLSTIATPKLISKMVQHGAQIGTSLAGSVGSGVSRGAGYAISAGTTASVAGASTAQTAAATAIGGVGGLVSGAAGTSGTFGSAVIGSLAVSALGSPAEIQDEAAEIASKQRKNL